MEQRRTLPWPGITLALATALGLGLAGVSWLAVLGAGVVWIGSLLIARPEPVQRVERVDPAGIVRDATGSAIEALGAPVLVLKEGRVLAANSAARNVLGAHVIGQDARVALRHPDATALIGAADGASVEISGFTGGRSLWQLTRRALPGGLTAIELADRSSEAQIGRAHTDFVANASHELRTPLSTIIGYVETLSDDDSIDRPTAARFLATVQREARRMLALVEDLMQLSQVEAEKHDRPSEQVDLSGLIATVVTELNGGIGAGRVQFVPGGACRVRGDARQLDQVVRNLSENALKYGDPDAPVEVALSCDDGRAVLTVRDQGSGIAAEHLPHLTRRFYRTDPGRSRAAGGTGLGLAIVKHIVERHGGTLDFASTLGEGTTVTVSVPALGSE